MGSTNTTQVQEEPFIEIAEFPEPPSAEAFAGLAGEFVELWEKHTEADRTALLAQFLVYAGHAFGRSPFYAVGGDDHRANLFVLLVGNTSFARKGQSQGCIECAFNFVGVDERSDIFGAPEVPETKSVVRTETGLTTYEGLINAVRDPREALDKKGNVHTIPGAPDKRIIAIESEFSTVLKRMLRDGNTISEGLRQGWDGKKMGTLGKGEPQTATDHLVSIIGHITKADLSKFLQDVDAANGFGNRFLFIATRRVKLLPDPGRPTKEQCIDFGRKLSAAIEFARNVGEMHRTPAAQKLWEQWYMEELNRPRLGRLHNAIVARCAPYIVRLSMVYALLDTCSVIDVQHLKSAKALWDYAERSSAFTFGSSLGDKGAAMILEILCRDEGDGLTTSEINRKLPGRINNKSQSLKMLHDEGLVTVTEERRGKTTAQIWRLKEAS